MCVFGLVSLVFGCPGWTWGLLWKVPSVDGYSFNWFDLKLGVVDCRWAAYWICERWCVKSYLAVRRAPASCLVRPCLLASMVGQCIKWLKNGLVGGPVMGMRCRTWWGKEIGVGTVGCVQLGGPRTRPPHPRFSGNAGPCKASAYMAGEARLRCRILRKLLDSVFHAAMG